MDHAQHVPGTVADCEECRRIAVEPGWYKHLSSSDDPQERPASPTEGAGERPSDSRRRDTTSRRRPAAARDVDLAAAELERRRMRVDLSRAEEGTTRVDLPDRDQRERTASKQERSE
jgi:hypothetical protein